MLNCGVSIDPATLGEAEGDKATPRLLARSREIERPEHVPRSPPGAQTCAYCVRGPPACPAAENAREDPRPEEKSLPMCKKMHQVHVRHTSHTAYITPKQTGLLFNNYYKETH